MADEEDADHGGHGTRRADGYARRVPTLRLFAQARTSAGTGHDDVPGDTVAEVLDAAVERYGPQFGAVLDTCKVWVNGDEAGPDTAVGGADEVAVLPPVSGGCC